MGMANGQIETSEKSILALEEAFTARVSQAPTSTVTEPKCSTGIDCRARV